MEGQEGLEWSPQRVHGSRTEITTSNSSADLLTVSFIKWLFKRLIRKLMVTQAVVLTMFCMFDDGSVSILG